MAKLGKTLQPFPLNAFVYLLAAGQDAKIGEVGLKEIRSARISMYENFMKQDRRTLAVLSESL